MEVFVWPPKMEVVYSSQGEESPRTCKVEKRKFLPLTQYIGVSKCTHSLRLSFSLEIPAERTVAVRYGGFFTFLFCGCS